MPYIVFYHYPCPDGEMSKEIWNLKHPNSIYYQWNHLYTKENYNLVNTHNNETLVFLDICPDLDLLKNNNNEYIIIDHHENAISKLYSVHGLTDFCNVKYSGCQLTWKYLYNNEEYPLAVKHIGNNDIWNFKDPNTEIFCAGYNFKDTKDFDYSLLLQLDDTIYNNILEMGKHKIEQYKNKAQICLKNVRVNVETINGKNIIFINVICKNPKIYKYLIEYVQQQYAGCNVLRIQCNDSKPYKYSLRSIDNITTVDDIARYYGGNGHPMAAGYKEE